MGDANTLCAMDFTEFGTELGAVTLTAANVFTKTQSIDIVASEFNADSVNGSHLHIEGAVNMLDNSTLGSSTNNTAYNQVAIKGVTLTATSESVIKTTASTLFIDNAPQSGTNQTITNAYALNVAAGAVHFGGPFIMEPQYVHVNDGGSSITISSSVIILNHNTSAGTQEYDVGDGKNGQIVHFFFSTQATDQLIKLDFAANTLLAGSGQARYLTFNTSGQSATLIFTTAFTDDNSITTNKAWRIINTGGSVS